MTETPPPPYPPFPEIRSEHRTTAPHPHRYRFRWLTAGGRRRQFTVSLVTPRDVATVERIIRADAARDFSRPIPPKPKYKAIN